MQPFKQAKKYLSPYKGNIILIFFFNILYACFALFSFTMCIPFLSILFGMDDVVVEQPVLSFDVNTIKDYFYYQIGQIIESQGAISALIIVGATMVLFSFLSNLFRYLAHYNLAPIRAGVLNQFRKDIYHQLITLPLSFYSKFKKGDILSRIGADVQEVEWSIISTLQILCRDPFMFLLFLITLLFINIKLTLIALIVLPLCGLLIGSIGKSIKRNAIKAQTVLGKMSVRFEETIGGLRVIKGYNAIDHAAENFQKENQYYTKVMTKTYRINDLGSPLIEFLCILAMGIILLAGASFVLDDPGFKGEILVAYIFIFARMLPPAKQLVTAYYNIQKGTASTQRINQIMEAEEVILEAENPVHFTKLKECIEYKGVSFTYDEEADLAETDKAVLHNINLKINKGEIIAITGSSGSGKSTMVDLLPRFYDIVQGEILIDGINNKDISIIDLRNLFGIVNQDVILFNDTVFNNIAFGLKDVSREMVIEAAKMAQAHQFIMEMPEQYDTIIGDRGMKLSGGERQRLSIARTFLKNPEILILDEATSALDNESEYLVQKALETLLKGKTAIIIAHRLSTIRQADTILFMEKGEILERGTHQELLANGKGYSLFCEK